MKRHGEGAEAEQPEKASKHTLESDEELDEHEKGGRMNEDELKVGQEAETIVFDGETKITPFNMLEELEEDGHFDASGTFIFKKINEVGDNWLEDVDWSEVRRHEQEARTGSGNGAGPALEAKNAQSTLAVEQEEALPEVTAAQQTELYRRAAALLRPGESVLRALRRLGGGTQQRQRNWKRRKDGTTLAGAADKQLSPAEAAKNRDFSALTEVANDLLGSGDVDIYQKTKEILEDLIDSREQRNNEDDDLDALGAAIDNETGIEPSEANKGVDGTKTSKWLVKRAKNVEADAEIEGPYEEAVLREWLASAKSRPVTDIFAKRQDAKEEFRPLASIDFGKLPPLS